MMKKTIILLTMTFALTMSLYATDSEVSEFNVESSLEKTESAVTVVLDGEPCGEVCGDWCPRFFPNLKVCGYTYCDSGNGGGTSLCMGGEYSGSPTPPDNTRVGTINP